MTKHSYLKQEIRARMAITGESYSAAARAIAKGTPLPSEGASTPTQNQPQQQAELRSLVIFTERLSVLLSGPMMELRDALEISEATIEDPALRQGIREVLAAEGSGESLESAIAARPWAFPGIFSAVISRALGNGSLRESMSQMSKLYRTEMELEPEKPVTLKWDRIARDTKEPFDWRRSDKRPLAVFIGGRSRGSELARTSRRWRFAYFPTVESFRGWDENSSEEIEAVLISDGLYSTGIRGEVFEELIAEESSRFFLGVISVREKNKKAITAAVEGIWEERGISPKEFYFIGEDWLETFSAGKVSSHFKRATDAEITSLLSLQIRSTGLCASDEPSIEKGEWSPLMEEPDETGTSETPLVEWGPGSRDAEIRRESRSLEEARSNPFSWKNDDPRPLAVYLGPPGCRGVLG